MNSMDIDSLADDLANLIKRGHEEEFSAEEDEYNIRSSFRTDARRFIIKLLKATQVEVPK